MDTQTIAEYYRESDPKREKHFWIRLLHQEKTGKQTRSVKKSGKHVMHRTAKTWQTVI